LEFRSESPHGPAGLPDEEIISTLAIIGEENSHAAGMKSETKTLDLEEKPEVPLS
jgi:hypothetical protein